MKIQVTQSHIDNAKVRDPYNCAIALAIKEKVHELTGGQNRADVFVNYLGAQQAVLIFMGQMVVLPPEMLEFLRHFDNYVAVEPFEFEFGNGEIQMALGSGI